MPAIDTNWAYRKVPLELKLGDVRGNGLYVQVIKRMREGCPKMGARMPQAKSFYEMQAALIRWFVISQIGQGLKERYPPPEDLSPKLLGLVRKLDDRD